MPYRLSNIFELNVCVIVLTANNVITRNETVGVIFFPCDFFYIKWRMCSALINRCIVLKLNCERDSLDWINPTTSYLISVMIHRTITNKQHENICYIKLQ